MPVRKINKNYRSVTGIFFSKKNNRGIGFESTLERDLYLTLEFDNNVESYEEQPLQLKLKTASGSTTYTPDCLICFKDGSKLVCEVKYVSELIEKEEILKVKHEAVRLLLSKDNLNFRVVTEDDLRSDYLSNIKFIYKFHSPSKNFNEYENVVLNKLATVSPCTVASLISHLSKETHEQLQVLPIIWHLVFVQRIQVDMNIPITNKSILEVQHE